MSKRICEIADCKKSATKTGLCPLHNFQNFQKPSELHSPKIKKLTRWQNIELFGWTSNDKGCWEWNGPKSEDGYGYLIFRTNNGHQRIGAHRLSYEVHKGEIDAGLFVCHTCDNPPCINPDHLFVGTPKQNSADAVEKGRTKRRAEHGRAKLTEADVQKMRSMRERGMKYRDIAQQFPVAQGQVEKICRYESWK